MEMIFRAIADTHRREILRLVQGRQLSAGDIADQFQVTRPAISQHLAVLQQAGLLHVEREGTRRLYMLRPEGMFALRNYIDGFVEPGLPSHHGLGFSRDYQARDTADEAAGVVEVMVRVSARRQTIFALFVDSDKMPLWMGVATELDPRPKGVYRVNMGGRNMILGEYVEITHYAKVVFTFGWQGNDLAILPGSTTVQVDMFEEGDDTIVRVRHSGLGQELQLFHKEGWEHYLARLAIVAGGENPGRDAWL